MNCCKTYNQLAKILIAEWMQMELVIENFLQKPVSDIL